MPNSPKIIAHCLVKNEERWVWYAIKSVLDFVDQIMVWDTQSTDQTVKIIKSISSPKIRFHQAGDVDAHSFTQVRQSMLTRVYPSFTWLMLLDGDEIWPRDSMRQVLKFTASNPHLESIVVRTNNLVGDIYHRLPDSSGNYQLAGRKGHLNLRFINLKNINGLHFAKPHGQQGLYDSSENLIQNRNKQKVVFLDVPYHHATHLMRSNQRKHDLAVIKRKSKLKFELGELVPSVEIPEIFFAPRPKIVPDVTQKAPLSFWLKAAIQTPFRRTKRKLFWQKTGY